MKTWELICSVDATNIDYVTTIKADQEPDFWTCYNIAAAHGCEFFTIQETDPGHTRGRLTQVV